MKYLLFIPVFSVLFFSCLIWDNPIPKEKKASFLYSELYDQYQVALDDGDLKKMRKITRDIVWVYLLDSSRKEQVLNLNSKINYNIGIIKTNKLKRARTYAGRKDYISAAIEYKYILDFEPSNKEARTFFKDNKEMLEKLIDSVKDSIRKALDDGNYLKAEQNIERIKIIKPGDVNLPSFSYETEKLKRNQRDEYIKLAKKRFEQNRFDSAIYDARLALKIDPNSYEAQKIIDDATGYIRKQTTVKKNNTLLKEKQKQAEKQKDEADSYYYNALDALKNKQYDDARREIRKCLLITDDQKAQDLSKKIEAEIKKEVDTLMGDAVLNYNSQKYEEALKLFNKILDIDRNNDTALDYKSRIEKRLKALDL